ncbi:MATE family efflux transporter [Tropicimonas sp. IMCC6043]|uniref:MATE family efflux transporter n=1 Tax=Tropicimonas sp. IMCC6043 TaxID=2510645 RepID=UPI00101B9CDD|nr:MATE family efflux transporter [Tropicimonas sp. IMCC6043]RYH07377.1 hypothetical protein EU800_20540 [Tropicimonas sp. IMCC6043]
MTQTLHLPRPQHPAWPFDTQEARTILAQAAPVAMVALVNMAMSVTDTIMAAAHGPEALAAVAVGSDFYSIVFYLVAGTIGGLSPLYAEASEARDETRLRTLRTAGWAIVALAAIMAVPLIWTAPAYLHGVGIDRALLSRGEGYTQAMAVTIVPMAATALLRCRLTAIERPGLLLKVTLAAVPLNAVGNQILMNGFGAWDGLGITGAGISSLVVSTFTALALLFMAFRAGDFGGSTVVDRLAIEEILAVGLPIGIATLAEVGIFLSATLYAATLGTEAAAAHSIAIRIAGVTYVLSVGLLQATAVRVARSRDHRRTIASAMGVSGGAGAILAALLLTAAVLMAKGIEDEAVSMAGAMAAAAPLIALLATAELVGPANAAAAGVLRGRKDTRALMAFSILGNWIVAAPLGIALASGGGWGATGIWLGLTVGSVTASLLTIGRLRRHWHPKPVRY